MHVTLKMVSVDNEDDSDGNNSSLVLCTIKEKKKKRASNKHKDTGALSYFFPTLLYLLSNQHRSIVSRIKSQHNCHRTTHYTSPLLHFLSALSSSSPLCWLFQRISSFTTPRQPTTTHRQRAQLTYHSSTTSCVCCCSLMITEHCWTSRYKRVCTMRPLRTISLLLLACLLLKSWKSWSHWKSTAVNSGQQEKKDLFYYFKK